MALDLVSRVWHKRLALASLTSVRYKSALCAYNAHLDAVVHFNQKTFTLLFNAWGSSDEKAIMRKSKRKIRRVDSPQIFLAALLQTFITGKAMLLYTNAHVSKWLVENLHSFAKYRIGGQAGIISNQLASLNASPILYAHNFSTAVLPFVNSKVKIPIVKLGSLRLIPARQAKGLKEVKVNWVVEYKKGDELRFASSTFIAPRSNRVILSTSSTPVIGFDDSLAHFLPELGKEVKVALIAGYHSLEEIDESGASFEYYLEKEGFYLQMLKLHNPALLIHVEFVPAKIQKIERSIYEHLESNVDSLGVNEVELLELTDKLGFSRLAKQLAAREDSISIYKAALAVLERLKLKRIHVHNLGYSLIVLSKASNLNPVKQRTGVLFASLVATSRAVKGMQVSRGEISAALSTQLSQAGFEQLSLLSAFLKSESFAITGIADLKSHFLILAPTQVAQNARTTVGLGDVISSTALVAGI